MKNLKKTAAILFAVMTIVSITTACAKDDASSNSTKASAGTNAMETETTIAAQTQSPTEPIAAEVGKTIRFGVYEQDNNLSNGMEPIVWRVLAAEKGKALLLSDMILDCKPYNETQADVTWEDCTLRTWLNTEFYNTAFSLAEQIKIETSTLVNDDNPYFGIPGGNNTTDKIFLLSYNDAINPAYGFNSNCGNFDTARWAQGTEYAKSQGLWVNTSSDYFGNVAWFLRTPGSLQYYACVANNVGVVNNIGTRVDRTTFGVRPALWINL